MSTNNNRLIIYYIYEIKNNINGKTYIGQRKCPLNKTPETDCYMGSGHILSEAKQKYGIENFEKTILEICYDVDTLDNLERKYILDYKKLGKAEYNIAGGGQTRCREYMTEEQELELNHKISQGIRNSQKWHEAMHSEERSRKLSKAGKGRIPYNKGLRHDKDYCEKLSNSIKKMYDSPKGEEVKIKIREKRKYQIITEETKKKISESLKGRIVSEETRKKLSESQKGKIISEETKQKIREKRKLQAPMSEESKQRQKESIQAYWSSPEGIKQKQINSENNKGSHTTKGKHWYNNGIKNIQCFECPDGFVPGRLGDFSHTEEEKQRRRDWYRNLTEEQKSVHNKKAADARRGKPKSDRCRENISRANRGRRYYNNGIMEVMRFECPEGFVPGRCPSARESIRKGMKR